MAAAPLKLLRRTTCPHCWSAFAPEEVLWVASHADLLGDPRLGPEQSQRFLPSRFDVEGNALDARGLPCHVLACPRCHLAVPRVLLEVEPTFVSILGTPACGKSFYLTALTWELRRLLPAAFALAFTDADPASNRSLNEYEELLFLNPHPDRLVPLADLIRKTELQGELYDTVSYGNQAVTYPRPFLFTVRPLDRHPAAVDPRSLSRVLCLYDNAGEHFQPGRDSVGSPVTQHLAHSRLLLFLFDPTQDPRFRQRCRQAGGAAPNGSASRTGRQESVLLEAAGRVRRYTGLSETDRHHHPLVVVVTKFDVWRHLLDAGPAGDPWVKKQELSGLDLERIESRSRSLRTLLQGVCPEVVTAAEDFAQEVLYVPVSALGRPPAVDPERGAPAVRPGDVKPDGVAVPLLYGIWKCLPGLVPSLRRRRAGAPASRPARPAAGGTVPSWLTAEHDADES